MLLLAGCARPEPPIVAVQAPIAPAPEACRTRPKPPPALPDRALPIAEFEKGYAQLKVIHLRQSERFTLCQDYVRRLAGAD